MERLKYGIEDLMYGMEQIFHTNSILAHFDMVLLKSGFSFSCTYWQTESEFD